MSQKNSKIEREVPSGSMGLRGQSVRRLKAAFKNEATRIAGKVKFHGNELQAGPLLSMIVAWFLEQPEGKRNEIAERGQVLYEEMSEPPKRTKRRKGKASRPGNPSTSEPVFGGGGSTKRVLSTPIPGKVDRGPKRRADKNRAMAEVED